MDRAPAPPSRRLRTVVPRWWRPVFVAMAVVAVGALVAGLALARGEVFLPLVLLLGVNAWQTWRSTHATVELDAAGITLRRSRRRRLEWPDVRALRLDPPGGERLLRAETARGDLVALPPLDDEGTEAVLAAHAAARERR